MKFQCSSASRKFLNRASGVLDYAQTEFQCSSASRKFLNVTTNFAAASPKPVSVLFSEPKIPQRNSCHPRRPTGGMFQCSSASRKFLNLRGSIPPGGKFEFQCSSASRKFLNICPTCPAHPISTFQCSSASRKFLKLHLNPINPALSRFSALQRAENSSIRPSHLRPSIFPTAMITLRHS